MSGGRPPPSPLHFCLKCSISVRRHGEAMHGDLPTERLVLAGRLTHQASFLPIGRLASGVCWRLGVTRTQQRTKHFASIDHLPHVHIHYVWVLVKVQYYDFKRYSKIFLASESKHRHLFHIQIKTYSKLQLFYRFL